MCRDPSFFRMTRVEGGTTEDETGTTEGSRGPSVVRSAEQNRFAPRCALRAFTRFGAARIVRAEVFVTRIPEDWFSWLRLQ
jgi:hypothetical protein